VIAHERGRGDFGRAFVTGSNDASGKGRKTA
jgi:hypothetical protein